jgi:hypothetical protein
LEISIKGLNKMQRDLLSIHFAYNTDQSVGKNALAFKDNILELKYNKAVL